MARRIPSALRDLSEHDRERLAYAKTQVEISRERWRKSTALLTQVIRDLHSDGCRSTDIAQAVGVTKQRVSQLTGP